MYTMYMYIMYMYIMYMYIMCIMHIYVSCHEQKKSYSLLYSFDVKLNDLIVKLNDLIFKLNDLIVKLNDLIFKLNDLIVKYIHVYHVRTEKELSIATALFNIKTHVDSWNPDKCAAGMFQSL